MPAPNGYLSGSVTLSETVRGKPRKGGPVWVMRYRLPGGSNSARVLGIAWTKRGRPPEGYLTRVTAEAELRRFLAEHEQDRHAPTAAFAAVAGSFVTDCERRAERGDFRHTTLRTYRAIVDRLMERWEGRTIADVREDDLRELAAELTRAGKAASTINQHRAVVAGIFRVACETYGLPSDPAPAFKRAKSRRTASDRISFYTPAEVTALTAAAESEQDAAVYTVAAFTGLRLSELRALRWRALDFDASLVHVERGYTDEGGTDLPKSYRVRSVPLMPQVARVLVQLRQREHFTRPDDLVFVNRVGAALDGSKVYKRFVAAAERAGLRRLRFHDLRHSFGTMAVRAFPLTDVQTWMGHADIATTRRYVHYSPQPDAAARLGALVSEADGAQVVQLAS